MVGFETFPVNAISKNKKISLVATEAGGHICWFEGVLPQRWYPKPVFDFINNIEKESKKDLIV
jgi:predicted alpha/beta-fold hydrolase